MKILLAAPAGQRVRGIISSYCKEELESLGLEVSLFNFEQHPYAKNRLISSLKSIIRAFLPSLPSPYDISPAVKSSTDNRINEMLIEAVSEYKPDLLLVLLGENIQPQTIERINQAGVITVNWVFDTLLFPYRRDYLRNISYVYDYIFIIDSLDILKFIDIKAKHIESLPLGCFPRVHRRIDLSEEEFRKFGSDVAFVGTLSPERQKILEALRDFDLKIWGHWGQKSPLLGKNYQEQNVYGEGAVKIYNASKIIIDIHNLYGVEKEIFNVTPRVFEVPACAGFLLTNNVVQLNEFYKVGEEIIAYKNIEELKSLIKYYLQHEQERKEVTQRAYQRAHQEHTYAKRLKRLLNIINDPKKEINLT